MKALKSSLLVSAALLGMGFPAAVQAQNKATTSASAEVQPQSSNSCVIELWVAKKYGYQGSSGGGQLALGLLGALIEAAANKKGDSEKKSEMMEIIPPEFIKEVFLSTDLTTTLKKESIFVNYHELSDKKEEINSLLSSKKRSTENLSECYYEVFVQNIGADKYLGNRNLTVSFKLKKFSGQSFPKVEKETQRQKLTLFPTKDENRKAEAASDLQRAFRAAVNAFVEKRLN